MSGVVDLPCGCSYEDYRGQALHVCEPCRERWEKQKTSKRNGGLQVGTSDGLGLPLEERPKKKIKISWTCSDRIRHEHRWKWSAYLCGRWQYLKAMFSMW